MPGERRIKGSVNRSQLVGTYGVGALVALGEESFMVAGTDHWPVAHPNLHEVRLERQLGVQGFVLPPASEADNDVPIVRFPTYYSCPSCKRLDRHGFFTTHLDNKCPTCRTPLVPSRFVVVCARGHIDDFPYFAWVHAGTEHTDVKSHALYIEAAGASASLRAIEVRCSCGKATTMQGSFGRNALKNIKKCTGRRPWLGDNVECDEVPRTIQRGASNAYFSVVRSSISIPPWSEGAYKIINNYWAMLKAMPESALLPTILGMRIAENTAYSAEDLVAAVKQRKKSEGGDDVSESSADFREQEYEALTKGRAEESGGQDFVCVPTLTPQSVAADWFEGVMAVKRLREVRALQGFTRLQPPSPADLAERICALSAAQMEWLPAVEVIGEGVFLQLESGRLEEWERRSDVRERAEKINSNYRNSFSAVTSGADREITPRLLLIHTLAHMMIVQWSMGAGYPAASLRERLYVSDRMAGLLIYTATSEAGGSLGGLIAEAEAPRLMPALREAVSRTAWCSSDPLCIEADAAGVDSLNLAACHACVLLPETSCEENNLLLDRALLVGTPGNPDLGYFASLHKGA